MGLGKPVQFPSPLEGGNPRIPISTYASFDLDILDQNGGGVRNDPDYQRLLTDFEGDVNKRDQKDYEMREHSKIR